MFNDFGAVTSIELPTIDAVVQAQLDEGGKSQDFFLKQSKRRKEEEFRFAQKLLQDTMEVDSQVEGLLSEVHGAEKASEIVNQRKGDLQFTKFDMLDQERVDSFARVMAHLQSDSLQVENAKATFQSLKQEGGDQSKAIQEKSS